MARRLEGRDRALLRLVHLLVRAQVDEDAISAIALRRAERLALHRQNALALLARALGEQLLQPIAEGGDRGRCEDGHLVALLVRQRAQNHAEPDTWILA